MDKKMPIKKISFILFMSLGCIINSVAQSNSNDFEDFELLSVHNNAYFYNVEKFENRVLFGSDEGIYEFKDPEIISLIDASQKGYTFIENNSIVVLPFSKIGSQTTKFNGLIPSNYRGNSVSGQIFKNLIFIVSRGKLFIFQKKIFKKLLSSSVRTISENYVGTYNGIFYKNKLIPKHSYTNGYIREYETEAFICHDALTRISNNQMKIIESEEDWKRILGNIDIEEVRDILKINNDSYLLFAKNGIVETNLKDTSRWVFKNLKPGEPRYIHSNRKYGLNYTHEIVFAQNNKLFVYNLPNKKIKEILSIDPDLGDIRGVIFEDLGQLYLITKTKFFKYKLNSNKNYESEIIGSDFTENHHLIWLEDQILISSNSGLSKYNTKTGELIIDIIKDEFNEKAFYKKKDSIFLGTTNGYYALANKELVSFKNPSLNIKIQEVNPTIESYNIKFVVVVIISFLALLISIFYLLKYHKKIQVTQLSKEKIIEYIDSNLSKVTVTLISEHFKSNFNLINNELQDIKIGELIRQRRIKTVRAMRKKLFNEESISIKTGFSISYLKKIK